MANRAEGVEGARSSPVSVGLIQRVSSAVGDAASNFALAMGWFPPGAPMPVVAPEDTDIRMMDYPVFTNTTSQPRSQELVSYREMRAMADAYYLLRLAIETRKDQIAKMPWTISVVPRGNETGKAMRQKNASDARIAELTAMLQYPDGEQPWDCWIASVAEEVLVTDAVTIYPRRTMFNPDDPFGPGKIARLEQVDGATIKRVIDTSGRTPEAPQTAYQQVLHGIVASNHTTDDLIYYPRVRRVNRLYGYSPVEQVILITNLAIRRFTHQLAYYTEGTVPEAIVQCPSDWSSKDVKLFQIWFDQMLRGNSAKRRRMIMVPGGSKGEGGGKSTITFTKEQVLKDEMDDYLSRVICFAFSLPPTALTKGMNRATAEQAQDTAKAEGLEPTLKYLENLMNFIIQSPTWFGFADLKFRFTSDEEQDQQALSEVHDLYLRNGSMTIDEVRDARGLDPIGMDMPCIYSQDGTMLIPVTVAVETGERTAIANADTAENPPAPIVQDPNNPGQPGQPGQPDGGNGGGNNNGKQGKGGAGGKADRANKRHESRRKGY
jgi:hypothetical protein